MRAVHWVQARATSPLCLWDVQRAALCRRAGRPISGAYLIECSAPWAALHVTWQPTMCRWDPIFEVDGFGETYAEMDKGVKNGVSHRYRSLDKLRSYLLQAHGA